MSKTNAMETGMLSLFFNNDDFANIGDAGGLQNSAVAGSFYVALHTADPGEAGSYAAECAYGSYARVAVARSSAGWTVSGNNVENTSLVQFPSCTSGSELATHFSVGTAASGGTMIYSGTLSASLAISSGIQPQFAAGALDITED